MKTISPVGRCAPASHLADGSTITNMSWDSRMMPIPSMRRSSRGAVTKAMKERSGRREFDDLAMRLDAPDCQWSTGRAPSVGLPQVPKDEASFEPRRTRRGAEARREGQFRFPARQQGQGIVAEIAGHIDAGNSKYLYALGKKSFSPSALPSSPVQEKNRNSSSANEPAGSRIASTARVGSSLARLLPRLREPLAPTARRSSAISAGSPLSLTARSTTSPVAESGMATTL